MTQFNPSFGQQAPNNFSGTMKPGGGMQMPNLLHGAGVFMNAQARQNEQPGMGPGQAQMPTMQGADVAGIQAKAQEAGMQGEMPGGMKMGCAEVPTAKGDLVRSKSAARLARFSPNAPGGEPTDAQHTSHAVKLAMGVPPMGNAAPPVMPQAAPPPAPPAGAPPMQMPASPPPMPPGAQAGPQGGPPPGAPTGPPMPGGQPGMPPGPMPGPQGGPGAIPPPPMQPPSPDMQPVPPQQAPQPELLASASDPDRMEAPVDEAMKYDKMVMATDNAVRLSKAAGANDGLPNSVVGAGVGGLAGGVGGAAGIGLPAALIGGVVGGASGFADELSPEDKEKKTLGRIMARLREGGKRGLIGGGGLGLLGAGLGGALGGLGGGIAGGLSGHGIDKLGMDKQAHPAVASYIRDTTMNHGAPDPVGEKYANWTYMNYQLGFGHPAERATRLAYEQEARRSVVKAAEWDGLGMLAKLQERRPDLNVLTDDERAQLAARRSVVKAAALGENFDKSLLGQNVQTFRNAGTNLGNMGRAAAKAVSAAIPNTGRGSRTPASRVAPQPAPAPPPAAPAPKTPHNSSLGPVPYKSDYGISHGPPAPQPWSLPSVQDMIYPHGNAGPGGEVIDGATAEPQEQKAPLKSAFDRFVDTIPVMEKVAEGGLGAQLSGLAGQGQDLLSGWAGQGQDLMSQHVPQLAQYGMMGSGAGLGAAAGGLGGAALGAMKGDEDEETTLMDRLRRAAMYGGLGLAGGALAGGAAGYGLDQLGKQGSYSCKTTFSNAGRIRKHKKKAKAGYEADDEQTGE